jgi:hypothetical protein
LTLNGVRRFKAAALNAAGAAARIFRSKKWSNSGAFTQDSATVTFMVPPAGIGGTTATTFNSLTLGNTNITAAQNLTVDNTLTMNQSTI